MPLAAVLAGCALLYSVRLGDVAFLGKDEPKNAQAAREMLRAGDWVVTTLDGEPWFDKPILYYWTALVAYKVVGVGELGARLGPAIAALLAVWITYVLGRRFGDRRQAALAALILGSGAFYFYYARTAVTDTLLTAAVAGTLTAYFLARDGVRPALHMHIAWAAAALAVLAKGPVGLALPALVIAADRLWSRREAPPPRLHAISGGLLFLGLAAPWHVLVLLRSDGQFFRDFILHRNIARYATEELPHPGPFWFYLPVLLLAAYPWSLFGPGAVLRLRREWKGLAASERGRLRFLLLWIVLPAIFFSFAGSKLPSYLLPVFPALAVLLAREVVSPRASLGGGMVLLAFVSAAVVAGGAFYVVEREPHLLGAAAPFLAVVGITGAAAAAFAAARLRRGAVPVLIVVALALPAVEIVTVPPVIEDRVSARTIARRAMELDPGPGPILAYRFYDNSFFFYTDSRTERYYEMKWIEARLREMGGQGLCFVRRFDLPDVLAHKGVIAEDLGAVEQIHLLRLTVATSGPRVG